MASKSNTLQIYNRSVNDLLYDYALSSAYKNAWIYDPSLALKNDADVWERVRNDASFMSSIDRSTRAIVKPWRIEAAKTEKKKQGKQLAELCEEGLGQIEQFDDSRMRLAESRYVARTYAYIESELQITSLGDTPEMPWIIPRRLVDIDRRRFRWIPEQGRLPNGRPTQSTKLGFFNSISQQWEDVSTEFRLALVESGYYNTEDRLGYMRGLLEPIYFAHYFKTALIEKILQWHDRWASPMLIVKLDSLRNSSTAKTNEDLRKASITFAQTFRSQNVGVIQEGDTIEAIEPSGIGPEKSLEMVHYIDDTVERLCNGSTRPSGQGGSKSGARAQAETEEDTSESFFQSERTHNDWVMDSHLLGFFIRANYANLAALGMAPGIHCKRPRFISEQIKRENPLEAVQVAAQLKQIGFDLSKSELAEKTGFSIPDPDEEIIEGQSMEMEAAMGGLQIDGKGKPKPFPTLDKAEKGNAKKD